MSSEILDKCPKCGQSTLRWVVDRNSILQACCNPGCKGYRGPDHSIADLFEARRRAEVAEEVLSNSALRELLESNGLDYEWLYDLCWVDDGNRTGAHVPAIGNFVYALCEAILYPDEAPTAEEMQAALEEGANA